MRVETFRLTVEFYDDSNHVQKSTFWGISRQAIQTYLKHYRENGVLKSYVVLDNPEGLVSFR